VYIEKDIDTDKIFWPHECAGHPKQWPEQSAEQQPDQQRGEEPE